jgi:hypothetical protein
MERSPQSNALYLTPPLVGEIDVSINAYVAFSWSPYSF